MYIRRAYSGDRGDGQIRGEQGVEGIDVGGYVTPVAEAKMKLSI